MSAPIVPVAPPRFSITTDWPHASPSFCPTMRAWMSSGPPGANGTIMRTGLAGEVWAAAGAAAMTAARASTIRDIIGASFTQYRTRGRTVKNGETDGGRQGLRRENGLRRARRHPHARHQVAAPAGRYRQRAHLAVPRALQGGARRERARGDT